MTSKIINMAEHIKDDADRMLESMFASDPIADDGFSVRVVRKVRRRIWVRRLTLPIAALVGAAVSAKPLVGLLTTLAGLVQLVPEDIVELPQNALPQLPYIVLGAMLLATCMVRLRSLED